MKTRITESGAFQVRYPITATGKMLKTHCKGHSIRWAILLLFLWKNAGEKEGYPKESIPARDP